MRFRARTQAPGLSEAYLSGKGELEDMLYQPKNDDVLFTFFGSLQTHSPTLTECRCVPTARWWSDAPTEIFVAGKIDHLDIALWASRFEGHVNPVARFRAPAYRLVVYPQEG